MRLSFWERQNIERKRNFIVVGTGLVGLSASIEIKTKMPGYSVMVVDKQLIGSAASTRNAGFACFGSVSEISSDLEQYGEDTVHDMVTRRRDGISYLSNKYGKNKINYHQYGGYEVFRGEAEFDEWSRMIPIANEIVGSSVFKVCKTPSQLRTFKNSIYNSEEGQLNTGLLYKALTEEVRSLGIEIVRGVEIVDVDQVEGRLKAKINQSRVELVGDHIILATNALTSSYIPSIDITPARNQVIMTSPIKNNQLKGCFHLDKGYVYFRNIGDRILIGGARHLFEEEETPVFGPNPKNVKYLIEIIKKYILPDNRTFDISEEWSGILTGGKNRLPIVNRLNDKITIAVRLGGMGVAIGTNVGIEAATLALQ